MNHQNYWADKAQRAKRAKDWTKFVTDCYSSYIDNSIKKSIVYNEYHKFYDIGPVANNINAFVVPCDSVTAVFDAVQTGGRNVCVLNFASYKEPGGCFLKGSRAQEECLCHESTLFPVLSAFNDTYYKENNKAKNRSLYLNRAIYSPEIVFIRNDSAVLANVLTCAAPNWKAARDICHVSQEENDSVLYARCEFILDIMQENHVDIPILGAFGAGVFDQDASVVANAFKTILKKNKYTFTKVAFAVIPGPNADAFKEVFS